MFPEYPNTLRLSLVYSTHGQIRIQKEVFGQIGNPFLLFRLLPHYTCAAYWLLYDKNNTLLHGIHEIMTKIIFVCSSKPSAKL